jgi:hypothetical protein
LKKVITFLKKKIIISEARRSFSWYKLKKRFVWPNNFDAGFASSSEAMNIFNKIINLKKFLSVLFRNEKISPTAKE